MSQHTNMIMLFARCPELGAVKTRLERDLAPLMDRDQAQAFTLALYEAFLLDTVDGLRQAAGEGVTPRVCFDPPEAGPAMRRLLGADLEYAPQHGDDLGARMANAFEEAFRSVDRAVLMGCDVPDYPQALAMEALDTLGEHHAVIAPSLDGGYFLIGFRKTAYRREFFENIEWGGATVLRDTEAVIRAAGLQLATLPPWNDVDHAHDALAMWAMHRGGTFGGSRTYSILDSHAAVLRQLEDDAATGASAEAICRDLEASREAIRSRLARDTFIAE